MKSFTLIVLVAFIAVVACKSPEEHRKHMKAVFEKCKSEVGDLPEFEFPKPGKPLIPREVKCMMNCVMEEMGVIEKENVDTEKFVQNIANAMDLENDKLEKLRELAKDCAAIMDPDRCVRGGDIFHCLKTAAKTAGIQCDDN